MDDCVLPISAVFIIKTAVQMDIGRYFIVYFNIQFSMEITKLKTGELVLLRNIGVYYSVDLIISR